MENENESVLKPCPFCGREATVEYQSEGGGLAPGSWYVSCSEVSCPGFNDDPGLWDYSEKDDAIKRWNHRVGGRVQHGNCKRCEYGYGVSEKIKCVWKLYDGCGRPGGPHKAKTITRKEKK